MPYGEGVGEFLSLVLKSRSIKVLLIDLLQVLYFVSVCKFRSGSGIAIGNGFTLHNLLYLFLFFQI